MNFDSEFEKIENVVKAAQDEIVLAVMFHETWKPTAYDEDLHKRMGKSFATHSFKIVRQSLRREMLLALMRLWDTKHAQAIQMTFVAEKLSDEDFFNAVVAKQAARVGFSSMEVMEALKPKREAIVRLIYKYSSKGGEGYAVLKKLRLLRHIRLAHRQTAPTNPTLADATDKEIESFYEDNLELIELLLSLVLTTGFNLKEASDVYRHHAKYFWANARGERTEGHPNYRPPQPH